MAVLRTSAVLYIFNTLSLALAATPTSSCSLVNSTASAGAMCGVRGDILLLPNDYRSGAPQFVASYKDCVNLCARRQPGDDQSCMTHGYPQQEYDPDLEGAFCTSCTGFLYTPRTGSCQLVGKSIGALEFQESKSSDNIYTELNCFNCPSGCDSPVGSQLLDNGDFSGQVLGPWNSGIGGALMHRKGASNYFACDSAKGYRISPYDSGKLCLLQQSFNACPDTLYSLRFDYKIPSVQGARKKIFAGFDFVGFDEKFFPGSLGYARTFGAKETQGWATAIVYFRSNLPNPLTLGLFDQDSAPNMIYGVTNVIVKRLPANLPPKSGALPLITGSVKRTQNLATKPGVSYLLSVTFSIPNTAIGPSIFVTFTEGNTTTAHFFQYSQDNYGAAGSTPHEYSIPYRAETAHTRLFVEHNLKYETYYDVPIEINNITVIELANF